MPYQTYYRLLNKVPTKKELWDDIYLRMIMRIIDDVGNLYGYRKMVFAIKRYFHTQPSESTIQRIMSAHGIKSKWRSHNRRKGSGKSAKPDQTAANRLDRDFLARYPLQKVSADVTDMKAASEAYHVCFVLDLYCNYPLGYAISDKNDTALVLAAFKASNFDENPPELLHTDRGSNFSSDETQAYLSNLGILWSQSRPGTPIDNASQESFNSEFKSIMEYFFGPAQSLEELIDQINYSLWFYKNKMVFERFDTLTVEMAYQKGLHSENPPIYPIKENKKIKRFKEKHYKPKQQPKQNSGKESVEDSAD